MDQDTLYKEINFNTKAKPHITIIIPVYNETNRVFNTIQSVLSQSYKNFDLIIVDDGSDNDILEKIVRQYNFRENKNIQMEVVFQSKINQNISIISKEHSGKSDSLNRASTFARGEYILFLDADTILLEDALSNYAHAILTSERSNQIFGSIVGVSNNYKIDRGSIEKKPTSSKLLVLSQEIEYINSIFFQRLAFTRLKSNLIISGAALLIKKSMFEKVEGFNAATMTEDLDLCMRVIKSAKKENKPYPIHYIPKELSSTEVPYKAKHFITQRSRWFLGLVRTLLSHRKALLKGEFGFAPIVSCLYFSLFIIPNSLIYLGVNIHLFTQYSIVNILWVNFIIILSNSVYSLFCLSLYQHQNNFNTPSSLLIKKIVCSFLYPMIIIPLDRFSHIISFFRLLLGCKEWGNKTRKEL
jgi:cellulose synthase/poly-beta-1,6-N-acetylglucosamine synthase-like glycosyltransferase